MNADMDTATTLTPIQVAGAVAVSHLDTASGELHRLSRGWNMGEHCGCRMLRGADVPRYYLHLEA